MQDQVTNLILVTNCESGLITSELIFSCQKATYFGQLIQELARYVTKLDLSTNVSKQEKNFFLQFKKVI